MTDNKQDQLLNLYNPATQEAEQLLDLFIDRKNLLQRILEIIRANSEDRPQQHVILLGPRGMGKTTLLCAIRHSICADDTLNAIWLPMQFYEEQYGIGDLADFWLEAIRHLEATLGQAPRLADSLLNQDDDDLAETAQTAFLQLLATSGKRALLLIDNLNDIFNDIDDGHALHRLRALWMTDPRIMVIGAAPSYFEQITSVDQAFYDFFRAFSLDRLDQQEMQNFLHRIAERLNDTAVIQVLEQAPERVAALRILTGGNPRLVKLGYRVLRDGLASDIRQDLERLLDESTPFFKHRIDSLAKEARRTFDAIARRWDPITVDEIRKELRKPSNYVSAQIKRLIDEGFVEEAGGDKKKRYQVSERFYNVYYLMRHSREGRRRLRWLVGFMQTFYTAHDYKNWARRLGDELAMPMEDGARLDKLAHLQALCAASDGEDGHDAVFEALVQDAINRNDRRALDEEIADGDPIEKHGWRYLLAEVVWLLEPEIRQFLGFKLNTGNWFGKLRHCLTEDDLMNKVEEHLTKLNGWRMDTTHHACAAGTMLEVVFSRYQEAEAAYRKAIELDPKCINAWNDLGWTLNNQEHYQKTEAAYLKAIEFGSQDALVWNNLGIAFSYQNRHQEAEAVYLKAIDLDPQHAYAWNNLSGTYLFDLNRPDAGIPALLRGLSLEPENSYGCYVLANHWQIVLPTAVQHIVNNEPGADNLHCVLIEILLYQAKTGEHQAVRNALLALDDTGQAIFEPLLLALQALDDRSLLYRIAREKRDLVLDVMAQIETS